MKGIARFIVFLAGVLCVNHTLNAQTKIFTHADSLKGTYSPLRSWWDVTHYALQVRVFLNDSSIQGSNKITYKVLQTNTRLQLDLMTPMLIDSIIQDKSRCSWIRDGNAFFVNLVSDQKVGSTQMVSVYFHGKPRVAKSPPWDGGFVWSKDTKGKPWISVACQGMSAGVWFPNKDHMADEVDSASMEYTVPKNMVVVSNGAFRLVLPKKDGTLTYSWAVVNPINNYNIIPYIGDYVNFKDTLKGKNGLLELNYWVLNSNYEKAKIHFKQVKPMLRCFEEWFGPYPFYEDGYKLVEAPYLGMEHQSAIAYGNNFENGYRGSDLSQTGRGLHWDFIIVHESGHEWFGNNISAKDVADNWIHESFTAYAENLYVEYLYGKAAGAEYVIGTRKAVLNDQPVIATYNVNSGGSIDIYYKGANMLHSIRQIVSNDSLWKGMLRGLNKTFWHQTVTSIQIEEYMSKYLNTNLKQVFNQYLRSTQIPVFEYKLHKGKLQYRWTNCVKQFNMPLKVNNGTSDILLKPQLKWKSIKWNSELVIPDNNFYCGFKKLNS